MDQLMLIGLIEARRRQVLRQFQLRSSSRESPLETFQRYGYLFYSEVVFIDFSISMSHQALPHPTSQTQLVTDAPYCHHLSLFSGHSSRRALRQAFRFTKLSPEFRAVYSKTTGLWRFLTDARDYSKTYWKAFFTFLTDRVADRVDGAERKRRERIFSRKLTLQRILCLRIVWLVRAAGGLSFRERIRGHRLSVVLPCQHRL